MSLSPEAWAIIGFIAAFLAKSAWDLIMLFLRNKSDKASKKESEESKQTIENMIATVRLEKNFEKLSDQLNKFDFKVDAFLSKLEKHDTRLTRLEVLIDKQS